jgi:hypothetical protein
MWFLSRHGGRYPDAQDINNMNSVAFDIQKSFNSKYLKKGFIYDLVLKFNGYSYFFKTRINGFAIGILRT